MRLSDAMAGSAVSQDPDFCGPGDGVAGVDAMSAGSSGVEAAGRAAFAGFRLRVVERTPSTQDVVRAAARAGAAAGYCCVAMEQSRGRGRQGRVWGAPRGAGLLVSVLVRASVGVAGGVPLVGGVAVCDAVEALGVGAGVVGVKWPNDVLVRVGRGKLAGVLAEVEAAARHGGGADLADVGGAPQRKLLGSASPGQGSPGGEGGLAVVLGVGLNLGVEEFPPDVAGASLHQLLGRPVGWEEALAALLTALGARLGELEAGGVAATAAAWRARAVGLGGPVEAQTPAGMIRGTALDIAEDGALLVDTGGSITRLVAGDVHLLPPPAAPGAGAS
jgi:BirA family biotin operon repressor/biotin-[acetyl-CoA-carboxylase] ligase